MHHTALHDWHVSHGGRMVDFAGWELPVQYTSLAKEHQAVRERAGLFDIAHMGRLRFTGPQACDFLDHMLTNDVPRMGVGQIRYSLICNEQGGILDDVLVYRLEDSWQLVVNASNREKILAWLQQHQSGFDVQVTDDTFETFMLALQGPRATEIIAPLTDADPGHLKYYTGTETSTNGVRSFISRTGYTGEDGIEIIVSRQAGRALWEALLQQGEALGLVPCGLGCRDTLRLEAGMPLYGHEMDEATDPLTAGLSFGVKLSAGDFIGKEALLEVRQHPTGRVRVGLELEGRRIAREETPILHEGQPVGVVTSGTFSPTLQRAIAMGYVPQSLCAPGTAVEVEVRGHRLPARAVNLPFYSRT